MILPSIEDENRYTAPPEPYEDDLHDCEPEDDIDWLEKNFGDNVKGVAPNPAPSKPA